ncbi:MAG: cysteine--tRNA ligase [Rickettsiales bacterium]|jgi:cysteinyl-tRNA synthetase|nr:cysteine--tRNA ligase [Rickettsiales bacterium]
MLKIFNSMNGKVEKFKPIDRDSVTLYACGLTVYDRAHLGHARTTIVVDLLVRILKELYKNVIYVRNITDVDDKINNRAIERNITIRTLTNEIIDYCNKDMEYLNNLIPTYEPRVTEHLVEIIDIIQKLVDNGNAYVSNGHVLFDVSSYGDYGKLSKINTDELMAGARIEVEDYKKNPLDFVLWKPSLATDDESSKFDSPWGIGRPGWHIECSAMSHKYLGENFDIHCGGADLKFPHHENEIAQSRCAFRGSTFANYWYHIGFLMIDGEKMSKSLGNFVTISELKKRGVPGCVIRFSMLKNHYRKPLDFTEALVKEAEKNLKDLHKHIAEFNCDYFVPKDLFEILCDDINTPKALALLNEYNRNREYGKLKNSLIFLGVFDGNLLKNDKNLIKITEEEVKKLIQERTKAKNDKNWAKSDEIRDYLKSKNVLLKDSKEGTKWEVCE